MKPIRTDGIYDVFDNGGEPFQRDPDRLDISLSLGDANLMAADRRKGLRLDDRVCNEFVDRYTELWSHVRPTHILVLGEIDSRGEIKPTSTVVDGSMWVLAARRAGISRVPVYMVVPRHRGPVPPQAVWLYFNGRHGLAPTEPERKKVLALLADQARNSEGISTIEAFAERYAIATGVPEAAIVRMVGQRFARHRTPEEIEEDRKARVRGESIGTIARRRGISKTAIRKSLASVTPRHAKRSTNGAGAHREAESIVDEAVASPIRIPELATEADAKAAARAIEDALRPIKRRLFDLCGEIERLIDREPDGPAPLAERFTADLVFRVWSVVDTLWASLLVLAEKTRIYHASVARGTLTMIERDARHILALADMVTDVAGKHHPRFAQDLLKARR